MTIDRDSIQWKIAEWHEQTERWKLKLLSCGEIVFLFPFNSLAGDTKKSFHSCLLAPGKKMRSEKRNHDMYKHGKMTQNRLISNVRLSLDSTTLMLQTEEVDFSLWIFSNHKAKNTPNLLNNPSAFCSSFWVMGSDHEGRGHFFGCGNTCHFAPTKKYRLAPFSN